MDHWVWETEHIKHYSPTFKAGVSIELYGFMGVKGDGGTHCLAGLVGFGRAAFGSWNDVMIYALCIA